jgi:hypothetical protein
MRQNCSDYNYMFSTSKNVEFLFIEDKNLGKKSVTNDLLDILQYDLYSKIKDLKNENIFGIIKNSNKDYIDIVKIYKNYSYYIASKNENKKYYDNFNHPLMQNFIAYEYIIIDKKIEHNGFLESLIQLNRFIT